MSAGRISVVVPNRDMGRFLPDAFASIERQALPELEVVLVDAGSGDESLDVAARWQVRGLPLRVEVVPGASPAEARNAGLERATGELVTFLDADDLFPREKLAAQCARMGRSPEVDVVSGLITLFEQLDPEALVPVPGSRTETLTGVCLGACLFRRRAFERIGRFDPTLLYSEDTDLFLRLFEARVAVTALPRPMLYYRRHGDSLMAQNDPRKQRDFHRVLARSIRRRADLGIRGDLPQMRDLLEPAVAPGGAGS